MVQAAWTEVRSEPRAFVAAALSGWLLALPTLFTWCWPLAFVALVPYLIASRPFTCDGRARTGVLLALLLATAWYGTAVHWLFTLARFHWAAIPAAFLTIALGLSEFLIVPVSLRLVHRRLGVAPPLVLPFAWVAMERLRWLGDLYFPWLDLGYDLAPAPLLVQVSDVVGASGVGFWILLVNVCIGEVVIRRSDRRAQRGWAAALGVVVAVALVYDVLAWRRHAPAESGGPRTRVAMVQPNIPQELKWDPAANLQAVLAVHAAAGEAAAARPQLMVMPETVLPFLLRTDGGPASPADMTSVEAMIGNPGVPMLAGAVTVKGQRPNQVFTNAAILYDAGGREVGRYEKNRLVPIVEGLPFPTVMGWVTRALGPERVRRVLGPAIDIGLANVSPGTTPVVLRADGLPPLGVMICYESVFAAIARAERRLGARLLVSISDDAWFGETVAGYQHAQFLVLRAVENRSWIVRSANSGISAVYDPRGTVVQRTRLSTRALLTADVPPAGDPPLYSKMPWDLVMTVSVVVTGVVVAVACVMPTGRRRVRAPRPEPLASPPRAG